MGQAQTSSLSCQLHLDLLFLNAHIMPGFKHSLLGIGNLCNDNYTVIFTKQTVQVFNPQGDTILTGCRNQAGPHLWNFLLFPTSRNTPLAPPNAQITTTTSFSAYYLPRVEALVRFYHTVEVFPFKSIWLQAINSGNFSTWPILTTTNATNFFPDSVKISKGHMTKTRQVLCSNNLKRGKRPVLTPAPNPSISEPLPLVASNGVHVKVFHVIKLYTGDMGRLPVIFCSRNQYSMLSYHCDSNSVNI